MYLLYRHPETKALAVTDITNTQYLPEMQILTFFGDDDINITVDKSRSDELIRRLFEDGRLDISAFDCTFYEWDDEDDDDDEIIALDSDFVFHI